ncbi:hypothetical protein BC830DRAFT_245686 [Chytriomyces sp. MP71]|nr:hypothetical protein BC830DRAFT_245686 [Chytriomyces sp. MP71]
MMHPALLARSNRLDSPPLCLMTFTFLARSHYSRSMRWLQKCKVGRTCLTQSKKCLRAGTVLLRHRAVRLVSQIAPLLRAMWLSRPRPLLPPGFPQRQRPRLSRLQRLKAKTPAVVTPHLIRARPSRRLVASCRPLRPLRRTMEGRNPPFQPQQQCPRTPFLLRKSCLLYPTRPHLLLQPTHHLFHCARPGRSVAQRQRTVRVRQSRPSCNLCLCLFSFIGVLGIHIMHNYSKDRVCRFIIVFTS